MRGVNEVTIVGALGNDPEVKQFSNGGSVTTISVATSEQWNDKQTGERREATEWHRIVLSNKLGEIAAQYLRKGRQVYIKGKLKTRKYQDQNGQDRFVTEIHAMEMQMLGGNQQSNQGDYQNNQPVSQAANQQFSNGQAMPQAYANNQQYAPQNPNQQQPHFTNNMQGQPQASGMSDHSEIPFNALNGQLAHLI